MANPLGQSRSGRDFHQTERPATGGASRRPAADPVALEPRVGQPGCLQNVIEHRHFMIITPCTSNLDDTAFNCGRSPIDMRHVARYIAG